MALPVVTTVTLTSLPKIASGKVRDLFKLDADTILFVASDRISAYDVRLQPGIPNRGAILTLLTAHWLRVLTAAVPGLCTHFLTLSLPPGLLPAEAALLRGRCMQVRRLKVFPIEAVVRGYLAGSAYAEYAACGTVNGTPMPSGLRNADALPGGAIYTPATKAADGDHDVNITAAEAAALIGHQYATRIQDLALQLYQVAASYAADRGIIIADTKFEFGLDEATDDIVLVDEVLTPDSSRFWPQDRYEPGREQDSFDKQLIRNWLSNAGLKGKEGVELPDEVTVATAVRYAQVFTLLTGTTLENALRSCDSDNV